MAGGMICAETLTDNTSEMTLEETITFLEPQDETYDETTKITTSSRAGAICQSAADWSSLKTSLEVACRMLEDKCTYEVQESITSLGAALDFVQNNKSNLKTEITKMQISTIPQKGNQGQDVLTLQTALNNAGYSIKTDGVFGDKTEKAISDFQKSKGLNGSGKLGPKTLDLLNLKIVARDDVTKTESITKDLAGKMDRRLRPELRLLLEAKVFQNGKIPECFEKKDVQACYVHVMKSMAALGIKESGGDNKGKLVGYVQGTTGSYKDGGNGDAWCDDYCQCGVALIEDYFGVESPVIGSAHCMTTYRAAQKIPGLVSEVCEVGTIAIARHGSTDSGHAMAVIQDIDETMMQTSEGNTSTSSMRNGDGSGLKIRGKKWNGNLCTQGFVRLYPNNKLKEV